MLPGLTFFADVYHDWLYQLSGFWDLLNTNVVSLLQNGIDVVAAVPHFGLPATFLTGIKLFLISLGFEDVTLLMFLFSIMGTGFAIYFLVTFVKWLLDIIT